MNFVSRVVLLIGVITLLIACGKDEPSGLKTHDVTFLRAGLEYNFYQKNIFFADGVKIVVEEQLAPDTFLVRSYSDADNVFPTQYWVLKDEMLYTSIRLRDPNAYQVECKFNQPVGTKWTVKRNLRILQYSIEKVNMSFTLRNEIVSDAIEVKVVDVSSGVVVYQYFSPSVGMLGTTQADETVDEESESFELLNYKSGTTPLDDSKKIPAITFGSLPFLKVGNYWTYLQDDFVSDEGVEIKVSIESKLDFADVYKVKVIDGLSGTIYYLYWYEDNGELKAYEEGESYLEADVMYVDESNTAVGHGWGAYTPTGTTYLYKIEALDETIETYFGSLSCMNISVSEGLYGFQENYWNKDKGNVYVSGLVERDLTESNARATSRPFIPVVGF